MIDDAEKWKKRYDRERTARQSAERLLEAKAHELYEKNQQLEKASAKLVKAFERKSEELHYSESKLREEEHRLTSLAASFPGVMYQWYQRPNGDCGFYYVSPRVKDIFGFTAEEAMRNWNVVQIHPDDHERWIKSIETAIADFSDWHFEGRLITPSGAIKWWRGSSRPVRGGRGEIIFNGIMLDITGIKRAEEQIRRLSLVASKTINGVIITDEAGRVVWINESFERISGYSLREMRGRTPGHVLQGPLTDPETRAFVNQKLKAQEAFTAELLNYHKSGGTYWLRLDVNPLFDERGELSGFIGIETDITQQKDIEAALKLATERAHEAAEEANRANQAKSRFLASMSHEIRTPLNGVLGYAQILNLRNDLPTNVRDMIQAIGRSGEHLLHLINDILDLSKIEAGKYTLDDHDIRLDRFLDGIGEMFRPVADLKGLALAIEPWDYEHKTPAKNRRFAFRADERALRQILLNLVGNAVKFTNQGTVTLRAGRYRNDTVRFEVHDTGVGIPESEQTKVFEAFEQSSVTSHQSGGTGLGLSICRKLTQQMQGQLRLRSTLGIGTEFQIDLPFRPPQHPVRPGKPAGPMDGHVTIQGGQRSILVVDDDPGSRQVLSELLQAANFRVAQAPGGREALHLVERIRPDLVATDLMMPYLDGFELCHQLRALPGMSDLPILAVSASVTRNDENAARLEIFTDFISKPIKASEVYAKVAAALKLPVQRGRNQHTPAASNQPEATPPADVLEELLKLAADGDLLELQRRLREHAEGNDQYAAFYARLGELANRFQGEAVETILQEALHPQPST